MSEVDRAVGQPCGNRRGNDVMVQIGRNQSLEKRDELMQPFERQIERELLDGNNPIPIGIVGAKHRTQRPGANLMKNTKWSEGVRWRGARSFPVQ